MDLAFHSLSWSADTNIYEVNLRQYTAEGSFHAFQAHLPRLRDMGIEILWFMPVTPISQLGRLGSLGSYYACSDYTNTNPEFGSLEDFTSLVKEAHRLGFKVLIDWVANHTGRDHRWTREHPEFYRRNMEGQFFDAHGWEDVIDLNYDLPALRQTMIGCMQFWIDTCDIDGFRCDMAMLVPLDFWKEARKNLDARKPLYWLAECEEIAYHEVFDTSYTWKFLHAMEDYVKGNLNMDGLVQVLQFYRDQFPADAMRAFFTSNHDENSHSGSEYERLGDAALPFAVFCATWNGIPLIYSGQELPNTRRLKFFDKDLIDWRMPCGLHAFYKKLLQLRKSNTALRAGDPSVSTVMLANDVSNQVMSFLRRRLADELVVLLNLSSQAVALRLEASGLSGDFVEIFTGASWTASADNTFDLAPWAYRVYEKIRQ